MTECCYSVESCFCCCQGFSASLNITSPETDHFPLYLQSTIQNNTYVGLMTATAVPINPNSIVMFGGAPAVYLFYNSSPSRVPVYFYKSFDPNNLSTIWTNDPNPPLGFINPNVNKPVGYAEASPKPNLLPIYQNVGTIGLFTSMIITHLTSITVTNATFTYGQGAILGYGY